MVAFLVVLVAGEWADDVVVFLGNGDGTFGPPTYFNANPLGLALRAAPGTGGDRRAGEARAPIHPLKPASVRAIAIGDLDGDTLPDIAAGLEDYFYGGVLHVLLGTATGRFARVHT